MVALFWQLEVSKTWLEGATIAGLRRKFGRWVVHLVVTWFTWCVVVTWTPGSPGSHLVSPGGWWAPGHLGHPVHLVGGWSGSPTAMNVSSKWVGEPAAAPHQHKKGGIILSSNMPLTKFFWSSWFTNSPSKMLHTFPKYRWMTNTETNKFP